MSVQNAEIPVIIIAKNDSAKCKKNLDVRWDGISFNQAARLRKGTDEYEWEFIIKEHFKGNQKNVLDKLTIDGEHKLEVRFEGEKFSEPVIVWFHSAPPIVEAKIQSLEGSSGVRIFSGKAASKLQSPTETIKVDVIFNNSGHEFTAPLPVEQKQDSEGRIYFQFDTPIKGLPKISPNDPRYKLPFFAFCVRDQAGNRYYHNMTYSQFIAPGTQRFGVNKIADIEVKKGDELGTGNFGMSFLVAPKMPEKTSYKGKPVIKLEVTARALSFYRLNWGNLPDEITAKDPATIIMRNGKVISIAFGNTYDDQSVSTDKIVKYQVSQKGMDGVTYKSNIVNVPGRETIDKKKEVASPQQPQSYAAKTAFEDKNILPQDGRRLKDPRGFCVTEDELFIIPDCSDGNVKLYEQIGGSFKLVSIIGKKGIGKSEFIEPSICSYNKEESTLGVMDEGRRMIIILERVSRTKFRLSQTISCLRLGYDMLLMQDKLIISGFESDSNGIPYVLYYTHLISHSQTYLLPSHLKFGLKSFDEYNVEYRGKPDIKAIGLAGVFDVQGNDIYYVWEGDLKIIKLNIISGEITSFGYKSPHYIRPIASAKLLEDYRDRDIRAIKNEREKMSFVSEIFTTNDYVFVIYERPVNQGTEKEGRFRLQIYTLEGVIVEDGVIPGQVDRRMWFDKDRYILYTLCSKSTSDKEEEYYIIKYKINL